MINSGHFRMNILSGNLAWKQNKRMDVLCTLKNFILVAFRVDCTGSQVGMM